MKFPKIMTSYPAKMSKNMLIVRVALAGIFTVMALTQLIAFEKFPDIIAALLPGSIRGWADMVAVAIVSLEVVAVPSLLVVPLSKAARWVSRFAGLVVVMLWYGLIFSGILRTYELNSGLLGEKIFVPANLAWLIAMVALFSILLFVQARDIRSIEKRRKK